MSDGKSGVALERVVVDGERYVVKRGALADDWIARALGDDGWVVRAFDAGVFDRLPDCIDPTVVAAELEGEVVTVVMRDVGDCLVPDGDEPVSLAQHERFVDHLAAVHAAFWGWQDDVGLVPFARRWSWMSPARLRATARGHAVPPIVPFILESWDALDARSPALARAVLPFHADPSPLLDALAATPSTFVHGDWKMANTGSHPDGRTVLVDWSVMGQAPGGYDLAHYLALNAARLPQSKEDTIAVYREGLDRRGIVTHGWFERQVELCLLGHMVLLAWEKAAGGGDELAWWEERVAPTAAALRA